MFENPGRPRPPAHDVKANMSPKNVIKFFHFASPPSQSKFYASASELINYKYISKVSDDENFVLDIEFRVLNQMKRAYVLY